VNRLALFALVAACDSKTFGGTPPQGFCPFGNSVDPGPGCTVESREVTIDGDDAEWVGVASNRCPDCQPGFVVALRALRTPDGRLALRADTQGPPLVDANHAYHFWLEPISGPPNFVDVRAQRGAAPEVGVDGVPLSGIPIELAIGNGIELAIPVAALPYRGGVSAYANLEVIDPTGAGGLAQDRFELVQACWDPTSPVCQPL
jgi:hypothetical protein